MGTRPTARDRRAQLLENATRLFWRHGFDGVTVAEIARATGITAGAVYKHVPDKETLLAEPIRDLVVLCHGVAVAAVETSSSAAEALERMIADTVRLAVDKPAVVGLWYRDSRHLPTDALRHLVTVRARTVEVWVDTLTVLRDDLTPADIGLRLRACLGLLNCVALPGRRGGRQGLLRVLTGLVRDVLLAPAGVPTTPHAAPDPLPVSPTTRRDELLDVSARLFRERGYHRVGMDEIGEAAGMKGPSAYVHVASKNEVLIEILMRTADRLDEALDAVLAPALDADGIANGVADRVSDPEQRLDELVGRYTAICLANRDLVAVYVTERHHLDRTQFARIERRRQQRLRRWMVLERLVRPELDEQDLRLTVQAALELIYAVVLSGRWDALPDLEHRAVELALVALQGPTSTS